jgi:hypothetical protein
MLSHRGAAAALLTPLAALACAVGAAPGVAPVLAGAPTPAGSVLSLASFGGSLWAGTDSGLDMESSGGWVESIGPIAGREINALAVSGGWLVAGTEDGAVRSRDGSTWVSAGLEGKRVASLAVVGGIMLAGTGSDTAPDGLVERSDDSGGTWRPTSATPALLGLPGETVQAVLAPTGGAPAWAGTAGGGALHSPDGRGGWTQTTGMATSWVTAFWRDPTAGTLLAGSDDGLYRWSGSAWDTVNFPQADPWVQALATGPGGHALAGTYDGAVYVRNDSGGWQRIAAGLPSVLSLLAIPGGGVLVGTSDGVDCIACPASVSAASAGPNGTHSRAAASLPAPASRAGVTPSGSQAASATPSSGGAEGRLGAAPAGSGSAGTSNNRWPLAAGLAGLSLLLFVAGVLRQRRSGSPQ